MQDYWVNFAKNGNPNGDNLPEWPLHKSKNWMKFTSNTSGDSKAIEYLREEKLNALEEGLLLLLTELEKTLLVAEY
jgi:para-nitrobenzyl esterase